MLIISVCKIAHTRTLMKGAQGTLLDEKLFYYSHRRCIINLVLDTCNNSRDVSHFDWLLVYTSTVFLQTWSMAFEAQFAFVVHGMGSESVSSEHRSQEDFSRNTDM